MILISYSKVNTLAATIKIWVRPDIYWENKGITEANYSYAKRTIPPSLDKNSLNAIELSQAKASLSAATQPTCKTYGYTNHELSC